MIFRKSTYKIVIKKTDKSVMRKPNRKKSKRYNKDNTSINRICYQLTVAEVLQRLYRVSGGVKDIGLVNYYDYMHFYNLFTRQIYIMPEVISKTIKKKVNHKPNQKTQSSKKSQQICFNKGTDLDFIEFDQF